MEDLRSFSLILERQVHSQVILMSVILHNSEK